MNDLNIDTYLIHTGIYASQTLNAYYHQSLIEVVFTAALLQPPFYDPNADEAVSQYLANNI